MDVTGTVRELAVQQHDAVILVAFGNLCSQWVDGQPLSLYLWQEAGSAQTQQSGKDEGKTLFHGKSFFLLWMEVDARTTEVYNSIVAKSVERRRGIMGG